MRFPKLSPLQSRMAASLGASLVLLLLYLVLSSPHFAYASEIDSIQPEDHNHERLTVPYITDEVDELEVRDAMYEPDFFGIDRDIIGRAPAPAPSELPNNVGRTINVAPDNPQYFIFTNTSLQATRSGPSTVLPAFSGPSVRSADFGNGEDSFASDEEHGLKARQASSVTLYITANTCLQPLNPNAASGSTDSAPQLTLYVSTSATNKNPGPGSQTSAQIFQVFENGFANYTLNATSDVYFSIHASNSSTFTSGTYSVEIAGSIDAPYHSYIYSSDPSSPNPNLHLIDSDTTSALLVTDNLTTSTTVPAYNQWMEMNPPPFTMFVFNQNNTAINGLSNSFCALSKLASAQGLPVQSSMSNITEGNLPKEQFFVQGLNGSSTYFGMLALGNSTKTTDDAVIGGGGTVWQNMTFNTQSDGACSVIYNLTFCSSVAYAVPGNFKTFSNVTSLAEWYDNQAKTAYSYFNNVLAQVPCEIESSGQYSLARTCSNCADAYKAWLCSVTIPRCMDFSNPSDFLQKRNLVQPFPNGTVLDSQITDPVQNVLYLNSSRNPNIDKVVQPGPYKEILPCADLCYDLVRSCPASMGFGCPLPGMMGFNESYGTKTQTGLITCNYPGAVYGLSGGAKLGAPLWIMGLVASVLCIILR